MSVLAVATAYPVPTHRSYALPAPSPIKQEMRQWEIANNAPLVCMVALKMLLFEHYS